MLEMTQRETQNDYVATGPLQLGGRGWLCLRTRPPQAGMPSVLLPAESSF